MRALLIMATLTFGTTSAMADEEYYMISRYVDGVFYASHKLYLEESDGLYEVDFCGRQYWTRAQTVAWLKWETENGRQVNLEYNSGNGWRRICKEPQNQINLADLGISIDYATVMRLADEDLKRYIRFSRIGKSTVELENLRPTEHTFHRR